MKSAYFRVVRSSRATSPKVRNQSETSPESPSGVRVLGPKDPPQKNYSTESLHFDSLDTSPKPVRNQSENQSENRSGKSLQAASSWVFAFCARWGRARAYELEVVPDVTLTSMSLRPTSPKVRNQSETSPKKTTSSCILDRRLRVSAMSGRTWPVVRNQSGKNVFRLVDQVSG